MFCVHFFLLLPLVVGGHGQGYRYGSTTNKGVAESMTGKLDIAARLEQNNNNRFFLARLSKAKSNKLLCKFLCGGRGRGGAEQKA